MNNQFTDEERACMRRALQDTIIARLKRGNVAYAKTAYKAYLKIDGYGAWFLPNELGILHDGGESPYLRPDRDEIEGQVGWEAGE